MPAIQRIVYFGIIGLMITLLSGASAIFIQSYAWVYMAANNSEATSLAELLFVDPPCQFCEMAEELNQQLSSQEGVPFPPEQMSAIKLRSTLSNAFAVLPAPRVEEDLNSKWPQNAVLDPGGRVYAPPTPPPRLGGTVFFC